MVGDDDTAPLAGIISRRHYLRSASWSDRSPTKSQPNKAARSCLPPLKPLSVGRRNLAEWPRAGSDDLGVWPAPPTPGTAPTLKPISETHPRAGSDDLGGCPAPPGTAPTLKPISETHPVRDFQFKREKLAFFDKECSRIGEFVYLGSDAVAKNREVLRQNQITHVLNCVGFVCPEYFKHDLVYKTLWLQDTPEEYITSVLYDVFDYFEEVRQRGGRVLVHCFQGVSRSASLVIGYVMWRDGRSFEDAFRYVKAARGVTNPNMGFACQLLQCQRRVHALPASPNSVLRMYRMAPHSAYDPLHVVPKAVHSPGGHALDSRGAFVVHVDSGIYAWTGRDCGEMMGRSAGEAASRVIRYERARGPVLSVREGCEPPGFWEALGNDQVSGSGGFRKVDEYDLDFEVYRKAIDGRVVPNFSVSNAGLESCLPVVDVPQEEGRRVLEEGTLSRSWSLDSFLCSPNDNTDRIDDICEETSSSPKFSSKSPTLSPSNSDYSASFTFSPSSSNWSDLSCLSSQQPSPSGLEHTDLFTIRKSSLADTPSPSLAFPANPALRVSNNSPPKGAFPSIAERRGSNPPPRVFLSSGNESTEAPKNLARSWSFSTPDLDDEVMTECSNASPVLFKCPAMIKVEMGELRDLSSRSGYVMLARDGSSGKEDDVSLYLWLGRDSSYVQGREMLLAGHGSYVGDDFHWQMVGRNLLAQMALAWNAPIQIVKQGEEPELFLNHLNHFLSREIDG